MLRDHGTNTGNRLPPRIRETEPGMEENMKKSMLILLCLCLLLSLCACGGRVDPLPKEALPRGQTSSRAGITVYENPWLGFSLSLDRDWYVYGEEELAQQTGIAADLVEGSEYEDILRSTPVFFDLFASRRDGASINLNFTDLKGVRIPDMDKYLDKELPYLLGMLEAAGMKNASATKNTVNLAGEEYGGVLLEADTDAGHYYCQQVYFVANGRLGALSLSCFDEDITPSLLELFRPLKA